MIATWSLGEVLLLFAQKAPHVCRFGLLAAEPDCECATDFTNRTFCSPHRLTPRPRTAFYTLQRLWNPGALNEAKVAFENASAAVPPANCTDEGPTQWNCSLYPSQPRLQNKPGTYELYLDCELFLMRGICYSPTPRGDDPGHSEPWGDYFTDDYFEMFNRDISLFKTMGANTIRALSLLHSSCCIRVVFARPVFAANSMRQVRTLGHRPYIFLLFS